MQIDVISDMQTLSSLQDNWDGVYEGDPEAQFFLSSVWLFKRLERLDSPWFVLAAKPNGDSTTYVAFFPLRLRLKMRNDGEFYNEITMAGTPAADYTGFICTPDCQHDAIRAFANHLRTLNWADLNLTNLLASDQRLYSFLSCFPKDSFRTGVAPQVNTDGIDNCVCPRVKLPRDWESYLGNALSPNMRQKVRRFLKQVETSGEFRITHTAAGTVEYDIETLLRLWEAKWGARKGERMESIRKVARVMLKDCFDSGSLFLPVLWKGGVPIGALASLIDTKNRSLLFYMGGRLEGLNNPSPGLVLHAYSIRTAIAAGFTTYDFLRGNEAYKYSFGAEERHVKCIVVRTRTAKNLGNKLDTRSLSLLLNHTIGLHRVGRLAEAEVGYRQALSMQPDCTVALYRLGQMVAARGSHREAERLFRAVIAAEPSACKAWFMLAQSLQAQARLAEAAAAYEEIVRRQPTFPNAYYNLGVAQLKLGRRWDAVASFETALDLQPNDTKARIGLAQAAAGAGFSGRNAIHLPLS
jgi:hypothetical protein